MSRSRAVKIAVAVALALGYSCVRDKTSNDEIAVVARDGETYRITLSGTRYLMVHDPVSLLRRPRYTATKVLTVPRLTGTVDGAEIPVKPGYHKLLGSIVFDGERMTVDLYYDNTDDCIRDPLSWNGAYTLRFGDEG